MIRSIFSAFSEMDIILRFERKGVGSIPAGPAKIGLIVIMGAHGLCKPEVGVRSPVGPPSNGNIAQR